LVSSADLIMGGQSLGLGAIPEACFQQLTDIVVVYNYGRVRARRT